MKFLKTIVALVGLLIVLCGASENSDRISTCDRLRHNYVARGFLKRGERAEYCMHGCSFLKVSCVSDDTPKSFIQFDFQKVWKFIEKIYNDYLMGDALDNSLFTPDDATVEVWIMLAWRLSSLLISVVPVVLNQSKHYNVWYASLAIVVILMSYGFGWTSMAISVHNALIAFLSLIANSNSTHLPEAVFSIVIILFPLFSIFIVGYAWHVLIVITVFIGFASYIGLCFFHKRRSDASVIVMITQLFVLVEQMQYVRDNFAVNSIGGSAIEMVLNIVIPNGSSRMFVVNAARNSSTLLSKLHSGFAFPIVFGLFLIQIVMFVVMRASLGAYYLHVLRFRTDFMSLVSGFYVYTCDLFGPGRCFYRLLFKFEKYSHRRVMYAISGSFLAYYEWKHALGFFVVRFVISILDSLIFCSKYGQMTHYLEFKIDCGQVAFPHFDAAPWFSVQKLAEIAEFTGVLTSKIKSVGHSGMGCALMSGGRSMLYSVGHVTDHAEVVQFLGRTYASPDFRNVSDGDDPITAMKADFDDSPAVELLRRDEVPFISQLFFVNTDSDGDSYACIVPKWDRFRGELRASVNLKKGDSGGPCFALIHDGEFRLCGVVSRGNARSGGGNIVSFCYHSEQLDNDSSDDESLGSVAAFNRVRRVRFAVDDPSSMHYHCALGLNDYINSNREIFTDMKSWSMKLNSININRDADDLAHEMIDDEIDAEERGGYLSGYRKDDDADDDGVGKRKDRRKDARRRRKDKAVRKRAIYAAKVLWEKLKQVYSTRDAAAIFDILMYGDVPELSERIFMYGNSNGTWVIGDSVPKPPYECAVSSG